MSTHPPSSGRRIGARAVLLTMAVLGTAPAARAQRAPVESAPLRRITQQLLDAITSGDSAVWARHLSPQWFITDEEGRHQSRAEFLKDLHGLPPGQQGRLQALNWHEAQAAGTLVLSYDIDEWHDFYGQELRTRFHSTDTWVRERGEWRIVASQITALPTPIEGRRVARPLLDEYAGTYRLTPDIELRMIASDSGLLLVRGSRPPERLHAIDERIFIRHGVRGFWLFERDTAGAVARVVSWRDNQPVVWRRAGR